MRVRVYRNLRTKTLSLQAKVDGRWKVIAHPTSVQLRDVKWRVSEAGRKRVLETGHKNVHAYLEGEQLALIDKWDGAEWSRVTYNPRTHNYFRDKVSGVRVYRTHMAYVSMEPDGSCSVWRGDPK